MSQFKKHTWKGLVVVAAMLLSVGLMTQNTFAAATASASGNTAVNLNTNTATGTNTFTTVNPIVITSVLAADFTVAGDIILTAPAGWSFDTTGAAPGVALTGTAVGVAGARTATTFTVDITTASGAGDTATISNLRIVPNTISSASGNIVATGVVGAPVNAASITGVVGSTGATGTGTKINLSITVGDPANIRADGTTAVTIQAQLFGDANANGVMDAGECTVPHQSVSIQFTTSRGTLSSTSSTTTSSAATTNASCVATIPFRGNGTTGTANVTAVTTQPAAAVATANLTITAGSITPTQIAFRDVTNSGNVASNVDTQYVTTNNVAQVRFRVSNGADQGSNGQVVQATVDKGNVTPWTDTNLDGIINTGEVPASCPDNVTTTFTTKQNKIDGTDVEGVAVFFVCAKAGQATGPIRVTAKNLTTTMSDATTTITSAGIPNKITATVTGNTVTVTVTDKDGNNVAEDTPVTFQVPSFTGTVAPACALTTAGKASASAAFSNATGGQVLITAFYNSSGAAAACPGGGNTVGASTTVNVGAGGGTVPGATGAGFTGTAPARGSIGLLVTAGQTNAASLIAALAAAGCTVESLAVLEGGVWKIYINGAPAVVNASFPGTVAATTAFFVRCAA